jgi:hypothetical protein
MSNNPFETNLNTIARNQINNFSNRRSSKKKTPVYYTAVGTPFRKSPTPNNSTSPNDLASNHSGFLTL